MPKCSNCGSRQVQAGLDLQQCLECGKLTDFEGNPAQAGTRDHVREVITRHLGPPETNLVGNFADLNRIGAAALAGDKNPAGTGVEPPPGISAKEAKEAVESVSDDTVTVDASVSTEKKDK